MAVSGGMDDSVYTDGNFILSDTDLRCRKRRGGGSNPAICLSADSKLLMVHNFFQFGLVSVCIFLAGIIVGFGVTYDFKV